MADPSTPVETKEQFGPGPKGEAVRWHAEVRLYEKQQETHWERCRKIIKRYRNERSTDSAVPDTLDNNVSGMGFSLLWANTETLKPVIYAHSPKANVQRRYKDKDPVARVAAEILERCLDFHIDTDGFNETIRASRDDYLLVGQGTAWQRYVPHYANVPKQDTPEVADEGSQVTNNAEEYDEDAEPETEEVIKTEEVAFDYVYWKDFGWSPGARTWSEVYCVWRKVYLTRAELIERFGKKIGEDVELDHAPPKDSTSDRDEKAFFRKATVYEIWDKSARKVKWMAKLYDGDLLDSRDDPLGLEGFFPCARPLFATQTSGQITPVPDYLEYQDQAMEMDQLTQKAYTLMEAIRVRMLYAGNIPEIQKLLQDSSNLDAIPVDQSIVAMSTGGLDKMVWVFPIEAVVAALNEVLAARERVKQDSYEITGISDIIRGQTDPNETLGAQELKAQTGAVRIQDRQQEMARFVRDNLRIAAQIIMNHFQPDTIADIADIKSIPEAEYLMIDGEWRDPKTQKAAGAVPGQAPQMGHNGGPPLNAPPQPGMMPMQSGSQAAAPPTAPGAVPPVPAPGAFPAQMPGVPQGLPMLPPQGPTLGQAALELLKDPTQRKFRIDIETDSTIALDQATEKQSRSELVTAISQFMTALAPIIAEAPELIPMVQEMLLFAVRGFKVGASLEGMIESSFEALANRPPAEPQPDPAMVKAQADAQAVQQKAQIDGAKAQADMQAQQQTAAMDAQARQQEVQSQGALAQIAAQLEASRAQNEQMLGQMELRLKAMELQIQQKKLEQADAGIETANAHAKAATKQANKPVSNGSG